MKRELVGCFFRGVIVQAGICYFLQFAIPLPTRWTLPFVFIGGIIRAAFRFAEINAYKRRVPGKYKIHGTDVYIR